MRSVALAGLIMVSTPVDAAACHRYSVWRYPWPQPCSGRPAAPHPVSLHLRRAEAGPEPILSQDGAIPLPALDWAPCPEADEPARFRLLLMEHAHAD